MRCNGLPLFPLLFLLATPALATNVPVQKEFRDWVVTCDNLRSCIAEGADKNNATLIVRFSREAGPRETVSLAIYGSDDGKLNLDGKPLHLTEADWYSDGTDDDMSFETDSQGEIHTLIDALRNGHTLTSGEATASLDGLSAALLLIDDVQGRLDTDSAWIRRGDKLPDAVPPAPLAPTVVAHPFHGPALTKAESAAVTAAALAQSKRNESADCDIDSSGEAPETQADRLDERDALVLVECYRAAYQAGYRVFRVPIAHPENVRMLVLPSYPGGQAEEILTDAEYDPGKATLSHFAKGRGIGDCGEHAQWTFDGRDFVLTAMASEPNCPGILLDFPVLWRSK
jgi:hypothetical protein